MADASLTNTSAYRKLKNITKLIHEIRDAARGPDDSKSGRRGAVDGEELAPAAVIIPTAPAAMTRGRGGKRKNPPRSSVRFRIICYSSLLSYLISHSVGAVADEPDLSGVTTARLKVRLILTRMSRWLVLMRYFFSCP